jgi:alpha-mannosidase
MSDRPVIYLIPHFHFDPVWLEDQRTYTAQAFDLVAQYLDAAREDPTFTFILSELDYLKPYWDAFPAQRDFIRLLIAHGRLELNGGYNEPNETSIHGEALIRNLLYGRIFQQGVLGITPRVYLPLDVFGHCPQLPQILRQLGFEACIFSKDIAGVPPLCRALALDGSEVIQKHEHYWFNPQSWEEFLRNVVDGQQVYVGPQPAGLDVDLRFIGMDMQPPPKWMLGRRDQLAQQLYDFRLGLPKEYLRAVEERLAARAAELPPSSRDLAMYHPGTTVSRIELKIANRLAENALFSAERFCTIAWLLGAEYPHIALDKAWRLLIFGQHHDAITGTPCDISFLDLMAMYREALEIAERINAEVLDALAQAADTAPARGEALCALVVFNPLSWERTDICRARLTFERPVTGFSVREASRREITCQLISARREGDGIAEAAIAFVAPEVPALGYSVYHVVADGRPPQAGELRETDRGVIENEFYTVTAAASAGGGVISIMDRQAKRQLLDLSRGFLGNEIAALGEQPDRRQAAWTVFTTGERILSKDEPARMWVERGPAMERIIVEGKSPNCSGRRQEIALYPGVRRIDFMTELREYRGEHQLFTAIFPFALSGCVPVFEERFGAVARRRSQGVLDFRTFQGQSLSGCALLPAQNWMELGNCLRITARRAKKRAEAGFSVGYSAIITGNSAGSRAVGERLMRVLAARGITASAFNDNDDYDADRLHTTFRFHLAIGGDNAKAQQLVAAAPDDVRGPAAKSLQRAGYAFVLTLEKPQGGGGDESADKPVAQAPVPALLILARDAQAAEAAIAELEKEAASGLISLPAQSNAVDEEHAPPGDYGVALMNLGNIGASVEADGTGVLALMHTTAWPNHPWGGGKLETFFVPEHKDHRFLYALCPHPADWRRGEVTRRAYEFNQPLTIRQCVPGKGCTASGAPAKSPAEAALPPRHSFLDLTPANVFLSALKPRGNPFAMGWKRLEDGGNSLIVRVYEGHGEPARVTMSSAFGISQVWQSNPLETRDEPAQVTGGRVTFDLAPYRIETLELSAQRQSLLARARFGPQQERAQPCHMRYWEHNLGPAPMGNQPVTVIMQGAPPIGATTRFGMTVANAQADAEAVGTVRVTVPQGWTITPAQVPFRVPAGGEQEFELAVIIPPDAKPGYVRADVEINGQSYQELLAVGEIKPVTAAARRVGDAIEVTVRNPGLEPAHGRVDLITPLETWGETVGRFAYGSVTPATQGFEVGAGADVVLTFEVSRAGSAADAAGPAPEGTDANAEGAEARKPDLWAYARVACHGNVLYVRAV